MPRSNPKGSKQEVCFLENVLSPRYVPHLSLARFNNKTQVEAAKAELSKDWQPVTWVVDEIYLLHRFGPDPFIVRHVIPLKGKVGPPAFGYGSPASHEEDESQLGRSLVVVRFPPNWSDQQLFDLFHSEGFPVTAAEVKEERNHFPNSLQVSISRDLATPNGKARNCGVVEFATRKDTNHALNNFKSIKYPELYLQPLWMMAFPDVIGGSCTLPK